MPLKIKKRSSVFRTVVLSGIPLVALSILALQFMGANIQYVNQPIWRTPIALAQPAIEAQPNQVDLSLSLQNELQRISDDFYKTHGETYGVYISHQDSNSVVEVNASENMMSASLYKLFVANEALKMIDDYRLSPSTVVDSTRNLNVYQCIEIMISASDNPCGVALQRITGAAGVNPPQLAKQGFKDTNVSGYFPTTTAADVGKFYQNLLGSDYLSESSRKKLMNYLNSQQIDNGIVRSLPTEATTHRKTGDLRGYSHDSGIIRTANGNEYVIVVMTPPDSSSNPLQRHDDIAKFSKKVYRTISGYELQL